MKLERGHIAVDGWGDVEYDAHGYRTQAQMTANLLEYGSAHQPATPWLRPALYQHGGETVNIITAELNARLAEMVEALAADYRSKG